MCYEKKFGKMAPRAASPDPEPVEIDIPGQMTIFDYLGGEPAVQETDDEPVGVEVVNGRTIKLFRKTNDLVLDLISHEEAPLMQYTAAYIRYLRGKAGE